VGRRLFLRFTPNPGKRLLKGELPSLEGIPEGSSVESLIARFWDLAGIFVDIVCRSVFSINRCYVVVVLSICKLARK